MVLPTLIMVSMVLLILVATLVSTGTNSLRTSTYSQQSEAATYAAEAGLVQAAEEFRSTGELPVTLAGRLDSSQASFLVTKYENATSGAYQVPGGPIIPPSTLYLLSEGTSANGTREKAGALFRTGLGAFQAGVISDSLSAEDSTFDAYDSSVNLDPSSSGQSDRGILASNRVDPLMTDPQFALTNTRVDGAVFAAAGTTPSEQIQKAGSTVVAREGALASPITIETIEVPTIVEGGKAEGGTTQGGSFDHTTYTPTPWRLTEGSPSELTVEWNTTSHEFEFYDDVPGSKILIGRANIGELVAASSGSPPKMDIGPNPSRQVHINFSSNKISYTDPSVSTGYIGNAASQLPPILTDAMNPSGVKTLNPDSLSEGAFKSVVIDDTTPTVLNQGVYVIEELVITDSGQLKLPADQKATIYVTKRLSAEGENALLNDSRQPTNLKIYYTGSEAVNLAGGSQSYLTLIAPDAVVKLEGSDPAHPSEFYGALVGKTVKVINAAFHFDVATEGVGTGTDGSALSLLNRHRL